jgi:hypothetical protein
MRLFNYFLISILILTFSPGCDNEKNSLPDEPVIYFTGLTMTDINGYTFSEDTTDWTFDDDWIEKEVILFDDHDPETCLPNNNYKIIAFPNPGNGIVAISVNMDSTSYLQIRLVDENFNKLIVNDSIDANNFQLDAGTFGIKDTVRLYYKMIRGGCEFRGHGDVLIQ